jgi:hypothetical protein
VIPPILSKAAISTSTAINACRATPVPAPTNRKHRWSASPTSWIATASFSPPYRRRFFCTSCHVPQNVVAPPVTNDSLISIQC